MKSAKAFLWVSVVIAGATFVGALAAAIPIAMKMRGEASDEAQSETLRTEAREKFEKGDVSGARALLDRVLAADPGDPLARSDLARVLRSQGDYAAAIAHDKIAIATAPDIPDLYYNVACYYALEKKKDEALRWLARAFAHGFGRLDKMRGDPDLAVLHGDEQFELAAKTGRFPDGALRVQFHRVARSARVGETVELDLVVEREVPVADVADATAKLSIDFTPEAPLRLISSEITTVAEPLAGDVPQLVTLRTQARYHVQASHDGILAVAPAHVSDGTHDATSPSLVLDVEEDKR